MIQINSNLDLLSGKSRASAAVPPHLDTPVMPIYSAGMLCRVIAALFVTIWLTLLGIEFLEDAGVFEYSRPEIDRSVESALAGLGEAVKISDDYNLDAVPPLSTRSVRFYPTGISNLLVAFSRESDRPPRKELRIYKLHLTLLI